MPHPAPSVPTSAAHSLAHETPSTRSHIPSKRSQPTDEPKDLRLRMERLGLTPSDSLSRLLQHLPTLYVHGASTVCSATKSESKNATHLSLFIQANPNDPLPPAAPRRLLVVDSFVKTCADAAIEYLRAELQYGVLDMTVAEALQRFGVELKMALDDLIGAISFDHKQAARLAKSIACARKLARADLSRPPPPDNAEITEFSSDLLLTRFFTQVVPLLTEVVEILRRPDRRSFEIHCVGRPLTNAITHDLEMQEMYIAHVFGKAFPTLDDLFQIPLIGSSSPDGFAWGLLPVKRTPSSDGGFGTVEGAQVLFAMDLSASFVDTYEEALVHVYLTPEAVYFGVIVPLDPERPASLVQQYAPTDLIPCAYILSPLLPIATPQLALILWLASASPLVLAAALAQLLLGEASFNGFRDQLHTEGYPEGDGRDGGDGGDGGIRGDEGDEGDEGVEGVEGDGGNEEGERKGRSERNTEDEGGKDNADALNLARRPSITFETVALDGSGAVWTTRVSQPISREAVERRAGVDATSVLERAVVLGKSGSLDVVVKYGEPEAIAREAQFLQIAGSLTAPRLFGVFGHSDADDGQWCIVQSFEGKSLADWQDLSDRQKIQLYARMADMHKKGVAHGDLAPRNVVMQDGRVKLIDFGEAYPHECKGEKECGELEMLWETLGMDV
ncbi:hypothetical protein JCM10296v2_006900 [Rhodotorula toruloides]